MEPKDNVDVLLVEEKVILWCRLSHVGIMVDREMLGQAF